MILCTTAQFLMAPRSRPGGQLRQQLCHSCRNVTVELNICCPVQGFHVSLFRATIAMLCMLLDVALEQRPATVHGYGSSWRMIA